MSERIKVEELTLSDFLGDGDDGIRALWELYQQSRTSCCLPNIAEGYTHLGEGYVPRRCKTHSS